MDNLIRKLLLTRDIARRNSELASEETKKQVNKKAEPHAFLPDQLVLLDEHSFLAKNQKLAPKWSGPHKILRLKGECNVELLLRHNNKKLIAHVNRLKPYFVPKNTAVESPDFFPAQKPAPPPPAPQQNVQRENLFHMMKRSSVLTLTLTKKFAGHPPPPCPFAVHTRIKRKIFSTHNLHMRKLSRSRVV
jgi:hypothetical protein